MEGSNQTIVENNDFVKNGWGLRILGDCFDDTIRSNNFREILLMWLPTL